jgi:hypothetical protein
MPQQRGNFTDTNRASTAKYSVEALLGRQNQILKRISGFERNNSSFGGHNAQCGLAGKRGVAGCGKLRFTGVLTALGLP